MLNPFKPITLGNSPNATWRDVIVASRFLVSPWRWQDNRETEALRSVFSAFFEEADVFLFGSGRSSLYALWRALGIGPGDEVLVPAFTCVAVPASVLWTGAKPVFVDIEEETLGMDPKKAEAAITPYTRAILLVHSFGLPAHPQVFAALARRKGLFLVEDCAHAFGVAEQEKKLGMFGDAAVFSFGRDKILSSVWGGALISREKWLSERLGKLEAEAVLPGRGWMAKQLLHPILLGLILQTYYLGGRALLPWLQKRGVLTLPITPEEKRGGQPEKLAFKLANPLAALLLSQLSQWEFFRERRRQIVATYQRHLSEWDAVCPFLDPSDPPPLLRFPLLTERAEELLAFARLRQVFLGDWYRTPIFPPDVDLAAVGYVSGSCPVAEKVCQRVVNLPTQPTLNNEELAKVLRLLREFFEDVKETP